MTKEIKTKIEITTPYFQIGDVSDLTEELWLVFHGYGQLAKYFIKHFEPLLNDKTVVVALQGLSKYYLDSKHERVGASWMTKDDRETDIQNQWVYMDKVLKEILNKISNKSLKINILGFSQGTATASRWTCHSKLKFNKLVLWAGTMAFELNSDDFKHLELSESSVISVMGTMDEYYNSESQQKELDRLKTIFTHVKSVKFEGKHEMNKKTLLSLS